ncbi:MAG: phosphorylcholine transferase LicD [Traorella sp.]
MENTINLEKHQNALKIILNEFDRICKKANIKYVLFAGTMLGAIRHHGFVPWDDDIDVIMLRNEYERFLKIAPKELDEHFYLQQEFSNHWPMFFSKLRLNNTTCLEKYHPKDKKTHQGIYIDIFPCDNSFNSNLMQKVQFISSKIIIAKALDKRGYETDSYLKKIFMLCCRILPNKPFIKIVQAKSKSNSLKVHSFLGGSSKFSKSIYKRIYFEDIVYIPFGESLFPVSNYYDEWLTILYGNYMELPPEEDRKCKEHTILIDLNKSWENYINYRDEMVFDSFTRSIR